MKRILYFFMAILILFSFSSCKKNNLTVSDDVINSYNTEEVEPEEPAPLEGKKIVCMGDSLFGMYRDETSSVQYIEDITGAETYNVGFGGTRISYHPYIGFEAFSGYCLTDAIISGDWSMQDAQVSSGEDYFSEQLAILKSIDFNTVDILVMHYGTNDFNGRYVPFENPEDPMDTETVCGAMNYSITKLKDAFPNLNIVISLPVYRIWYDDSGTAIYSETRTDSFGNTLVDLIEAMKLTAEANSVDFIDSYSAMGIDQSNADEYLPDGTHFNEEGRRIFGEYIGNCLNQFYTKK